MYLKKHLHNDIIILCRIMLHKKNKGGIIMSEKFGTMIIDGRIINLDTISDEELDKLIKKLEQKEENLRQEIDELLDEDIDD